LTLFEACLGEELNEKPGVTHFLPARVERQGAQLEVKALKWQGSGDVAALGRSNCYVVVPSDAEKIEAGEKVTVLLRRDIL
jgi:molybdopterin molybdotransferase